VQPTKPKLPVCAIGLAVIALLVVATTDTSRGSSLAGPAPAATVSSYPPPGPHVYLPLVDREIAPSPTPTYTPACPTTSDNSYSAGIAYQHDGDNPVRPAYNHADKNLALRGYTPNTDSGLQRDLVNYGTDAPSQPPQLATLFDPYDVPPLSGFYQVYAWNWATSPEPGSRGEPLSDYSVTALGLQTTPGQPLYVPTSAYDIGGGMEVLVLYADEDTIALRYTREDSSGSQGYTLHVDKICTDPNLLAMYNTLDDPSGPRYVYSQGHTYDLPCLWAGQPFGTAKGTEIVVAIVDTGQFMDPRSCNEWCQIRPGYEGGCPGAVMGTRH